MRERQFLRQRYRAILSATGAVLALVSPLFLLPLLALPAFPHEAPTTAAFLYPAALLGGIGFLAYRLLRLAGPVTLTTGEGGVVVLLSWLIVCLVSAWPFLHVLDLDASRALFESVSGWTTTGLSVVDVTRAPGTILLWRSAMQLAGGAGLATLMMSALVGSTGVGVTSAEGRGEQLVPHVGRSARLVLSIYTAYAAFGILALRLAGMSWFDAVNHAFAAVSTGGFSTRSDSIGAWDSPVIEAVTLPLMILGNLSFVTAWLLWRGKLRAVARNGEVLLQAVLIPLAIAALLTLTCRGLYPSLSKSVRVALFESVTAITTTGFSTVGYGNWNAFGWGVLLLLMLIGGGTCSTAGGIKQLRVYLLARLLVAEIRRGMMPRTAVSEVRVWEGDQRVDVTDARARQVGVFLFLYLSAWAAGTLVLCACGIPLPSAMFEFASALGTVGLSVGVTSASMPDAAIWTETVAMFTGRLEYVVVFAALLKMGRDALSIWVVPEAERASSLP